MADAAESWITRVHCLVLRTEPSRVLVEPTGDDIGLPCVSFAADDFELPEAIAGFRERYGLEVRTLRCLYDNLDEGRRRFDVLLLVEALGAVDGPERNCRWVSTNAVPSLCGLTDAMLPALQIACAEFGAGFAAPKRRPWERPGWHARPEAWMRATATALGYSIAGPVDDYRTWSMTRILRMPTERGLLYFKASGGSSLFGNEAVVTRGLADLFPGQVPRPIAIAPEESWMLTEDFGEPIGNRCLPERRNLALRQFAELQIAALASVDALRSIGCLDRSLAVLDRQIVHLSETWPATCAAKGIGVERIKAAWPRFRALCAEMAGYRVPHTLVHGDLHMNNVAACGAAGAMGFLFFDWTDACIAHPFLDLLALNRMEDEAAREAATMAYLEPWTAFESMARLRELLALARPLIAMHQVISYRAIDEGSDTPFMDGDEPAFVFWMRQALDSLPVAEQLAPR